MATLLRQVVLECKKPTLNINKYYEISIFENGKDRHYVQCRWGRIENFENGNPQSQVKGSELSWGSAEVSLGSIMFSKLKKGYKVVIDQGKGTPTQLPKQEFASKSQAKRVAAQKGLPTPTFERTEHIEVIVSDWWRHDNIEERVV